MLCGWTLDGSRPARLLVEGGLLVPSPVGRRPCSEPGTVVADNGLRLLCDRHAEDEAALLAGRRDRRAEWLGWRETSAERAERLAERPVYR
ncbi:hypothetical protein I601_3557 [Nocardioides dokdonensis FR1436]|uniref:Uncharacterized protein n=1 Tax=Nocardioides dokdonensis FR1436 TaxID=1300347 RepID=A0A1A9GQT2_9ACTN|nr:hypothetical protein [Nocardioides dokdonensis]ANH39963.1 hypothetical protein I601_3557 [Nocardioides dokdonensis FR1436]